MIRRLQGATRKQWEQFDRHAARAGYRTTSRWVRDVCVRESSAPCYHIEVRTKGGAWVRWRKRVLSQEQCALALEVLRSVRVTARAVEVSHG